MISEQALRCPYCDAPISLVIDLSAGDQSYIEDCEVCCQPMQVQYSVVEAELESLVALRMDD